MCLSRRGTACFHAAPRFIGNKTISATKSAESIERLRSISLKAMEAERDELESLRIKDKIGVEDYLGLQEQLDWSELSLLRDNERKIEEI
jgi:monovalent cation/hydrogen antiporter